MKDIEQHFPVVLFDSQYYTKFGTFFLVLSLGLVRSEKIDLSALFEVVLMKG